MYFSNIELILLNLSLSSRVIIRDFVTCDNQPAPRSCFKGEGILKILVPLMRELTPQPP